MANDLGSTTLKINDKHQTKVSAHFVFSPVCKYTVLLYPTGFDFSLKNKIKIIFFFFFLNLKCWVLLGCPKDNQFSKNFQFESQKMKLSLLGCPG